MLRKKIHHAVKISPLCGEIIEILSSRDCDLIDIAVVLNIKPTQAHYHLHFSEIYFVLDGSIRLGLYDPNSHEISEHVLLQHELMLIKPHIHHKILSASKKNRLCVISLPGFDPSDEHSSDKM